MDNTIQSLVSFIQRVEDVEVNDRKHVFLYRGQADANHSCIPSIGRPPYRQKDIFDGTRQGRVRSVEWALYTRFRDLSAPYESSSIAGADSAAEAGWRRLILARHHLVPTRLLDWTMKPLVALFFAVHGSNQHCEAVPCKRCGGDKKRRDHDAGVYMMKCPSQYLFSVSGLAREHKHPPMYKKKRNLRDPGFFIPPDIHHRVAVQGSVFSIASNPRDPVAAKPWTIIRAQHRATILRELDQMGINYATLFPDLEGIGKWLAEAGKSWSLRRGS